MGSMGAASRQDTLFTQLPTPPTIRQPRAKQQQTRNVIRFGVLPLNARFNYLAHTLNPNSRRIWVQQQHTRDILAVRNDNFIIFVENYLNWTAL